MPSRAFSLQGAVMECVQALNALRHSVQSVLSAGSTAAHCSSTLAALLSTNGEAATWLRLPSAQVPTVVVALVMLGRGPSIRHEWSQA
mmetsp:Transcript_83958/g.271318  ORF Transcript_83958/g.271318 Transcript_83958/m.271318 type:complete len:88 (-) Transcript_83958:184-447(-)